jgi:cholesterol oxidase
VTDAVRDFDFIVIGSGFGGSVAAHRLTEKGYRVAVMEMGRRWTPENLPRTNWTLWRWIWRPGLALRGFFNIEPFRHVLIMHGCAVGGGSITYANTLLVPRESIWENGSWAGGPRPQADRRGSGRGRHVLSDPGGGVSGA